MKHIWLSALFLVIGLTSCAVPVPPTGGPPDTDPPSLESTQPEQGQTLFSGRTLQFMFDEPVDVRSFTRAFSITPDINGIPEISGSGKRVTIKLPEDLRPATTYIVSLDASLRDVRSVPLTAPITLAFSTGETIDKGKLNGRIVRSIDGAPAPGADVFAFANHDSLTLSGPPLYRTQTGSDGSFTFTNLAEAPYFILALRDANSNRRLDVGEAVAVPPLEYVLADTVGSPPKNPWILSLIDREAPKIERVRAINRRDLEVRFSERLALSLNSAHPLVRSADPPIIKDSTGTSVETDLDFFYVETNPREVFVRSSGLRAGSYVLEGWWAVQDSSGNQTLQESVHFTVPEGLAEPEGVRFMTWIPDSTVTSTTTLKRLWPLEELGIRTNVPPDTVLQVVVKDTSGVTIPVTLIQSQPNLFILEQETAALGQAPFFIELDQSEFGNGDSLMTGFFQFESEQQTGEISFMVYPAPAESIHIVTDVFKATDLSRPLFSQTDSDEQVRISGIPGGMSLMLRVHQSALPAKAWYPGTMRDIWAGPEPIAWIKVDQPVRARWETVLPDTLDFRDWPMPNEGVDPGQPRR